MKIAVHPVDPTDAYLKNDSVQDKMKDNPCKTQQEKPTENIRENFIQSSSLHGVNKLQKESGLYRRIIWTTLILGLAVALVFMVTQEILNFYTYPTSTNIQINRYTEMPFPAVTICNLSPYSRTKLESLGEKYTNFLMKYMTMWGDYADPVNWSDPEYYTPLYMDPVSPDSFSWGSMNLEEMFQDCKFDGVPCQTDTAVIIPTDIGPCFTFNGDGKLTTTNIGALNNLELRIFIDQDDYTYSYYMGSGIKVVVHKPGEMPDILNKGFIVPPGQMAHAAIQSSVFKNLPAPYKSSGSGYCIDVNIEGNPLKCHNYTYYTCKRECETEYLKNKVGCAIVNFPVDPPYCSLLQYPLYLAASYDEVFNTVVKERCISRCPNPCEETKYDVKVNYAQYPSNFIANTIRTFKILDGTKENMRENFLTLNLYYEDLVTIYYEQIPKYGTFGDVFANVGGQMGLFLGASILTLVEIIEFIGTAIVIVIRKVKQRKIS